MDKPDVDLRLTPMQTLGLGDLRARLVVAQSELEALAPAPRVEMDRESILTLVSLALQALATH